MDLLKSHKRRSRVSEILYITLNIGLAVSLFVVVLSVQSTWLAYLLVLLSKWRALAVRPRFWFANLVANLVDIIVGLAVVTLMYAASGIIPLQAALAVIYSAWLLFIKPRSSKLYVALQAAAPPSFGNHGSFARCLCSAFDRICRWYVADRLFVGASCTG
ncbi:hypothetical protein IPF89_05600 [Candidatus Saccharibacteria bacterium]|nr:MAG: hypothetical protein IPF89_05600 [Candidatus Saccharibacteria bacterium]